MTGQEPAVSECNALYEALNGKLVGFVANRVRDRAVVDDLCADIWLAMFRRWSTFNRPAGALFTVAKRRVWDWYEEQQREPLRLGDEVYLLIDKKHLSKAHDLAQRDDEWIDLKRALARLTPRRREAIFYHFVDDLDVVTVAELMGIGVNGVKKLVTHGLVALRTMPILADYGQGRRAVKEVTK